MDRSCEGWRFMRKRAEQMYEEGDVRRALWLMRRINQKQEEAFCRAAKQEEEENKIVSTH